MTGLTWLSLCMVAVALFTARFYYVEARMVRRDNLRLRSTIRKQDRRNAELLADLDDTVMLLNLDAQFRHPSHRSLRVVQNVQDSVQDQA